jgi:hypothetical protein
VTAIFQPLLNQLPNIRVNILKNWDFNCAINLERRFKLLFSDKFKSSIQSKNEKNTMFASGLCVSKLKTYDRIKWNRIDNVLLKTKVIIMGI